MDGDLIGDVKRTDRWYNEMLALSGIARTGDLKGTVQMMPWGRACWDLLRKETDSRLEALGLRKVRPSAAGDDGSSVLGVPYVSPEVSPVPLGSRRPMVRPTGQQAFRRQLEEALDGRPDRAGGVWRWSGDISSAALPQTVIRTGGLMWMEGLYGAVSPELAFSAAMSAHSDVIESLVENVGAAASVSSVCYGPEGGTITCRVQGPDGGLHVAGRSWWRRGDPGAGPSGNGRHLAGWNIDGSLLRALLMNHKDRRSVVLAPAIAPVQAVVMNPDGRVTDMLRSVGVRTGLGSISGEDCRMLWGGNSVVPGDFGVPIKGDLASNPAEVVIRIPSTGEEPAVKKAREGMAATGLVQEAIRRSQKRLLEASKARLRQRSSDDCPGRDPDQLRRAGRKATVGVVRIPHRELGPDGASLIESQGAAVLGWQSSLGEIPAPGTPEKELVAVVGSERV